MNMTDSIIKYDERISFDLRRLYALHGYVCYKMSKFEEYDLYVRNKDFLISDSVITFTDTSGKLLALKPDVTLSIINNTVDSRGVQKVYYNENVYRAAMGTHNFKELMQVGLECIGDIDMFSICEVIELAAQSLCRISPNYILDISHMGIVSAVLDKLGFIGDERAHVLKLIESKNLPEIRTVCESCNEDDARLLKDIVIASGSPLEIISLLRGRCEQVDSALCELEQVVNVLEARGCSGKISIDFSLVNDMNYYNGIVFRGFIDKVPTGVLSGGQYDKLMRKLGRTSGAIGFAVYIDLIERLGESANEYDVDVLLMYEPECDVKALCSAVDSLTAQGLTVSAQSALPETLKYRKKMTFDGKELAEDGSNA